MCGDERSGGAPSSVPFADEQDQAVDGEEDRGGECFGEQSAERVLERDAGESGADCGNFAVRGGSVLVGGVCCA